MSFATGNCVVVRVAIPLTIDALPTGVVPVVNWTVSPSGTAMLSEVTLAVRVTGCP